MSFKHTVPDNQKEIVLLEPFYGGSHKQLIEMLLQDEDFKYCIALYTLPDKKWHWKARTSALMFHQLVPHSHNFKVLFCSSTLNLCELTSLRPDLQALHKIIYFHENQLFYPQQDPKERDFQYGYNQILSCLVADVVVFNSKFNMESFLREIPHHFKIHPQPRPDASQLVNQIQQKCKVLYFPICSNELPFVNSDVVNSEKPLHIVWPHRWEHDKDPETFFKVLMELCDCNCKFKLSVLGQSYGEAPPIFNIAKEKLSDHIQQWGYASDKIKYWEILLNSDVIVSTSKHEFYGVAMLEGVLAGCYPLCPNSLVYPEIYPKDCVYNTPNQLRKILKNWCLKPHLVRNKLVDLDVTKYTWESLKKPYKDLLQIK